MLKPQLSTFNSNFVYFPLPYRTSGKVFSKKTNNGTLSLVSNEGVPYGLFGRLALIAITKLATSTKTEKTHDISVYELLREIKGKKPTGSQLDKFEKQLISWASTMISFRYEDESWKTFKNLLLIKEGRFALQKNLENDETLDITFTDEGLSFFRANLIPVPAKAIQEIDQPFKLDILCWLILRVYQCREKDYQETSWDDLYLQFKVDKKKNASHFRSSFSKTLHEVRRFFYPEAQLKTSDKGIWVGHSQLLTEEKTLFLPSFKEEIEKEKNDD